MSVEDSFTVEDVQREIMERIIKLEAVIQRWKDINHAVTARCSIRRSELLRLNRIIVSLSPGCDNCVDGVITEPKMAATPEKELRMTVSSYACPYCANQKGDNKVDSADCSDDVQELPSTTEQSERQS